MFTAAPARFRALLLLLAKALGAAAEVLAAVAARVRGRAKHRSKTAVRKKFLRA